RIGDVQDRFALGTALHTLENGGEETAAPAALAGAWLDTAGNQNDEARQVFVFRAQAVSDPGTKGRAALAGGTGEEEEFGRGVVELVRGHGTDHAHFMGDSLEIRNGVGHPDTAGTVLPEGARSAEQARSAGSEGESFSFREFIGTELAGAFHQFGFVIE